MSSFRFGALVGGLVGYVLGTRAGRQRYEQIAALARSAGRTKPAQQLGSEVRGIRDRATDVISEKATEGVARVSSLVRGGSADGNGERDGNGDGGPSDGRGDAA